MEKSKLDVIKDVLKKNSDIVIVNQDERNYFPEKCGEFSQTIMFWVSPKKGLYDEKELQMFMNSIFPELKPDRVDNFKNWDSDLEIGQLYFDESIEELNERRFNCGEDNLDYKRRIWVRVYPCEKFARDILKGEMRKFEFKINKRDLDRYRCGY